MDDDTRDPSSPFPGLDSIELSDEARARLRRGEFQVSPEIDALDAQALLEELRVHQIELQMQNDELSRINARLNASRDWYFALFEASAMPLFLLENALVVREANLAVTELLGWDRRVFSQQPFVAHIAGSDHAAVTRELRECLSGAGGRGELDRRVFRATLMCRPSMTDRPRECELHVCRLIGEDEPMLLVGVLDITERENVRRRVEDARATADRANQMKTRFLANISHELRAPLTSIIGYLDLVLTGDEPEDAPRKLGIARRAADLLFVTVSDLLDLSRIEADRFEVSRKPVSLERIVRETLELFEPQCVAAGLVLESEIAADLPEAVLADELRFRQIMGNLLTNAIKYTEQGSVCLGLAYREGNAVLTVVDTGIGIPADRHAQIFQPFEQVESTDARRATGAGLGLALCKRITDELGGAIFVRSEVGVGSTFTVQLPMRLAVGTTEVRAALDPSSALERRVGEIAHGLPSQPSPAREDAKILIVDDEPALAGLIEYCLRGAGHRTVVVNDGLSALERLAEERFDLVLLDMQMPELDGFETASRIRARFDAMQLPIVAVTASAMRSDMDRCLDVGCNAYLSKPINVRTFAAQVGAFLPAAAP